MAPEIWSGRFFCHFRQFLFFCVPNNPKDQNFEKKKKMPEDIIILHMCTRNDSHIYNVWFLRYGVRPIEFFVILDRFLPFYHPNNPENQTFEKKKKKMKKMAGDLSFYTCVP